jgi:UDP-glucuronate decarboxylase
MDTPDSITGPVNLGNPAEFTILELASQIKELTGSRSKIVHRPLPQDDPRQRCPDISKAQELLKWQPQTALRDGLTRTIAYFQELLKDNSIHDVLAGGEPAQPT